MATKPLCSIPECGKPHYGRGWCRLHYKRWYTHGDTALKEKVLRTCQAHGCNKPYHAHGWCRLHYDRWLRTGDPLARRRPANGEAQRYLEEVVLSYENDDCLIWPFASARGYGKVSDGGKIVHAHRMVCEKVHGVPPTSKHEAAHSCGDSLCVNHRHLRWATHAENEADKEIHGTNNRGKPGESRKLSEKAVLEIFSLRGEVGQREIAARFGVSRSTVGSIHSKKRWVRVIEMASQA